MVEGLELQLQYSINQGSPQLQVILTTNCTQKELPSNKYIYVSISGGFSFIKYIPQVQLGLLFLLDALSDSGLLEDISHLQFLLYSSVCTRSIKNK